MDWLPITVSAILLAAAAAWTVLHEDTSTVGTGRHRLQRRPTS
ncbi:hypothetical protein [Sinomonas albida]|nr:hypothetical protein [Sinomonas albida]